MDCGTKGSGLAYGFPLGGIKVVTDNKLYDVVWEFPKDRFIEYEPKDESWCRKLGIGKEKIVPKAFMIGNTLVAHPIIIAELKKRSVH